jgi:hypothetical protein
MLVHANRSDQVVVLVRRAEPPSDIDSGKGAWLTAETKNGRGLTPPH